MTMMRCTPLGSAVRLMVDGRRGVADHQPGKDAIGIRVTAPINSNGISCTDGPAPARRRWNPA